MSKKNIVLPIMIAITLFVVIFHIAVFSKALSEQITQNIHTQLAEISSQGVVTINAHLNEQISTLSAMSEQLLQFDDLRSEEVYFFLDGAYRNKSFLRIAINFPDGSRITHDRLNDGNVSEKAYFIASMNGEKMIDGPSQSIAEPDKTVVILATPIFRDNKVIASLSATYDTNELDKLFNLSFLENNGYMFIAKSDGTIITNVQKNERLAKGDNFLDYIKGESKDEDCYSSVKSQLEGDQASSNFILKTEYGTEYMNFAPIGINDWYLFSVVPENVMKDQAFNIEQEVINLGLVIAICVSILGGFIIYTQVVARNKATLNERCFHVLAQQIGKVMFEWDFNKNKISALNNFMEIFGRELKTVNLPNDAIDVGLIHHDDIEIYEKIFTDVLLGKNVDETKFRVKNQGGEFLWCSLSGVVVKDRRGNPYKAIGSLENIDQQEKEAEKLRTKASIDELTGLSNKATTEALLTEILASSSDPDMHAVISADIDNFKNINDSFGHFFGDEVLIEIATELKNLFRLTDIIGRFGGDEFVLCIRDIPSGEFIKTKVLENLCQFEKTYRIGDQEHSISISVGIALYPKNGSTYEELYKKADAALYMAKQSGKNTCFLYDDLELSAIQSFTGEHFY